MRRSRLRQEEWNEENFIFNINRRIFVSVKWNGKKYVIIHAWVDKSDKEVFDVLPDREVIKIFPWAIYRRDWQKVLPIVGQEGECLDLVEYYKIMVNRDNGKI